MFTYHSLQRKIYVHIQSYDSSNKLIRIVKPVTICSLSQMTISQLTQNDIPILVELVLKPGISKRTKTILRRQVNNIFLKYKT